MYRTGTLRLKSDSWDGGGGGVIEILAADTGFPAFHHCHSLLCHSQSWLPFFILLQQKVDSYLSAVVDVKGLYPASTESGQLFVSCSGCERSLSCFNRK